MPKIIIDMPDAALAEQLRDVIQESAPPEVTVDIEEPVRPEHDKEWHRCRHDRIRNQVLKVIKESGTVGVISDEVITALPGHPYGSITQRYHELIYKRFIYRRGKRPGNSGVEQSVMHAYRHWAKEDTKWVEEKDTSERITVTKGK
jgi:hypothetical protein